jgi:hypothetical protein
MKKQKLNQSVNQVWGGTLTLLCTVVLFGFSFTLSSCEKCSKGKDYTGSDGNTNNKHSDINPSSDGYSCRHTIGVIKG